MFYPRRLRMCPINRVHEAIDLSILEPFQKGISTYAHACKATGVTNAMTACCARTRRCPTRAVSTARLPQHHYRIVKYHARREALECLRGMLHVFVQLSSPAERTLRRRNAPDYVTGLIG